MAMFTNIELMKVHPCSTMSSPSLHTRSPSAAPLDGASGSHERPDLGLSLTQSQSHERVSLRICTCSDGLGRAGWNDRGTVEVLKLTVNGLLAH